MSKRLVLVGVQGLAEGLGRSRWFVHFMKKCGYEFSHGRLTTVDHGADWLARNPQFRATKEYLAAYQAKVEAAKRSQGCIGARTN